MPEDEMIKYGVELNDEKVKEAGTDPREKDAAPFCPTCGKLLDNGGSCPDHGTKPFEGA